MLKLAAIVVSIVAVIWLAKLLLRMAFNVAVARSPNTRKRDAERETIEEAEWFGKTGLDQETERELPRYLRRELGEYLDDPAGLKSSDLRYLGIQSDTRGTAHFWALPERHGDSSFAYAQLAPSGEVLCLGWGDWAPPN